VYIKFQEKVRRGFSNNHRGLIIYLCGYEQKKLLEKGAYLKTQKYSKSITQLSRQKTIYQKAKK